MHLLHVSGINKKDERGFELRDISFGQQKFQKIAIAGETGSGKTTLLKIIAGLVQPNSGEVRFEGEKVIGPDYKLIPGHPGIAYLSQQFDLPHFLRVEQVLTYANELPEKEADALYEICRISHLLKRRTDQLSGGEKQRIALARLLVSAPRLLLLDEPFSNMDMGHKNILKSVIHDVGEKLKITCMMVSHDPLDTLSWADAILVMKDGTIIQEGSPEEVYRQPVNEYTAALFGKYNIISAAQANHFSQLPGIALNGKNSFVRPENFKITTREDQAINGKVTRVTFFGSYYELEVLLGGKTVTIKTDLDHIENGDPVYVTLLPDSVWYI